MSDPRPAHRPRKDPAVQRVSFHVRAHPDAIEIINRVAKVLKKSRGEAIDQIAYFYACRGPDAAIVLNKTDWRRLTEIMAEDGEPNEKLRKAALRNAGDRITASPYKP